MLQMPLPEIFARIREKAGLADSEIGARVDEKLRQLSGLVSREGAAHIVANELGVKLFDAITGRLQLKNILAGMRNVETVGKVMAVYEVRAFQGEKRSGRIGSFILGDETGTVRVVCWNEQADAMAGLSEGAVVKLRGGYVKENNGRKEIHLGERSVLIMNPDGESIGDIGSVGLQKSVRKRIHELADGDDNVAVLATIVQAFEPHFFETCPDCNRRVKPDASNAFVCSAHNQVVPSFSYVANAILDDGTETVRAVFFRNQANLLFSKSESELLSFRASPERFEELKNGLLGTIVKAKGVRE